MFFKKKPLYLTFYEVKIEKKEVDKTSRNIQQILERARAYEEFTKELETSLQFYNEAGS